MPSCAARAPVVGDVRAESSPIFNPTRCAQTMTMPSRIWNCLLSLASPCSTTRASVRTPSTSNSTRRMRAARFSIESTIGYRLKWHRRLEHFSPPEIVDVDDACDLLAAVLDDDDRRNLALFHDVQ